MWEHFFAQDSQDSKIVINTVSNSLVHQADYVLNSLARTFKVSRATFRLEDDEGVLAVKWLKWLSKIIE